MKILVVSDSHGNFKEFYYACKKERPEILLFLGDLTKDAYEMENLFPNVEFHIVRGNCDYYDLESKEEKKLSIKGTNIFMTHGHGYNVKKNYKEIQNKLANFDIVIFGHTHIPYLKKIEKKFLFNPGALALGSYGIITIDEQREIKFVHKNLG